MCALILIRCQSINNNMMQSWTRSKEKSNLHSLIHTCFHTVLRVSLMCLPLTHFIFSSPKDKRKIANVTPALIRKVAPPIELYKNPPKIRPKMLAKAPKLPAKPCTAPWSFDPARLDNMDMKDGHIRPLTWSIVQYAERESIDLIVVG